MCFCVLPMAVRLSACHTSESVVPELAIQVLIVVLEVVATIVLQFRPVRSCPVQLTKFGDDRCSGWNANV